MRNPDMVVAIQEYEALRRTAERKAKTTARAAANAEVQRIARVGKRLD